MYQILAKEQTNVRVLLVDDFESMRKVTNTQLKSLGITKVTEASNGAEALRILATQPIDLILSDWNMPVMTGIDFLRAVRQDPRFQKLPFVMITAEADRNRVTEAIQGGVSDLLVKPYTGQRLMERIERALTQRPRRVTAAPAPTDSTGVPELVIPPGPGEAAAAPVERDTRGTILIVDDTPDNLTLLSGLLKGEYRTRIAHNGEKALQIACSDNPPDLVLLDIMMPGIDGFEVLRRMREHPNAEHIPVIFITALTGEESMARGLELGAVDYITKPINPETLKVRVRNFMRYVDLHRQLQADYDAMLEAEHLKEEVDHIVRHDMKGPLAGVIGLLQTLAEDDMLSRKQIEQLRLAEETALQVVNMVNLSSELYKMETGQFKLDPKPVAIGDILRRLVETARETFREKHLVISVDTDVPVGEEQPMAEGDALLCYSLFQNLLKNACEAAPEKSRISVVLHDRTPLCISLRNKGAVPEAIRARFFDKFVTHGKSGGTGIGTYSARLLSEAQKGAIELEVLDDQDETVIRVTLPRLSTSAS